MDNNELREKEKDVITVGRLIEFLKTNHDSEDLVFTKETNEPIFESDLLNNLKYSKKYPNYYDGKKYLGLLDKKIIYI